MTTYTDARIAADLATPGLRGSYRAAQYLEPFAPELRDAIAAEARTMMNLSPGWRWSDCVEHVAARFAAGDTRTPYGDEARELARAERERRDAQLISAAALLRATGR